MTNKIRVVVKKPRERSEILLVEDTLETYQKIVGGYIEAVPGILPHPLAIYCNEEGKLVGLEPNISSSYDIIVGPVVALGTLPDGNNRGLSEKQALAIKIFFDTIGKEFM